MDMRLSKHTGKPGVLRSMGSQRLGHDFSSAAQACPTLCNPMNCSMPGLPVHHQLLEFTQTHVHRVDDAIQPSHPLSSPSPPAPNLSQHQSFPMSQLFMWGGQSIGVSASASVFPKNTQDWSPLGWTGWISLQSKGLSRVHKSLLQHHSSKASILPCSAFFIVQFSHLYMTTGKTIALTSRTCVGKVMSLLLNMLSRLVITFLPRSKRLLISWLQSPSAVILGYAITFFSTHIWIPNDIYSLWNRRPTSNQEYHICVPLWPLSQRTPVKCLSIVPSFSLVFNFIWPSSSGFISWSQI